MEPQALTFTKTQKGKQLLSWLGVKKRGRRVLALFPISLWNVYEAVTKDWDKTNNGSEGYNRAFANLLQAHYPSLFKFINGLKVQQNITEVTPTFSL